MCVLPLTFDIAFLSNRDLKTANIFLTKEGVVKLGDFGISKQLEGSKANTVLGTPYYISPEMVSGCGFNKDKTNFGKAHQASSLQAIQGHGSVLFKGLFKEKQRKSFQINQVL